MSSSLVSEIRRDLKDMINSIITYLKEIKKSFETERRNKDKVHSTMMQKLTNDLDDLKGLHSEARVKSTVYMSVLSSISSISVVKSYIDSKDTNKIVYFNSVYERASKAEEKILEAIRLVELI